MNARDRLIVALDVPAPDAARALVDRLSGVVGMFKVGSQLFTEAGPPFVRELVSRGEKVFLDLKYHDIPNTVANAVGRAAEMGVSLLTVHALGGRAMMEAAMGALPAMGTRVLAITVLTSHAEESLGEVGIGWLPCPRAWCAWPASPARPRSMASWPRPTRSAWCAAPAVPTSSS